MLATYADDLWAHHMIFSPPPPPPGRLHHEPGGRLSFPEIQPKMFFLDDDTSPMYSMTDICFYGYMKLLKPCYTRRSA